MAHLCRTVLIWLMALALPAQGMAAAAMLHCGPGHHGTQASIHLVYLLSEANPLAAVDHAAHGHATHHAHDAETASSQVGDATSSNAAQPDLATVAVKFDSTSSSKCSACASCCVALALPSTVVVPANFDPAREVGELARSSVVSVMIDGLERPPRISPA